MAGTNIAISSETFNKASDKSWIRARMGMDTMLPIMLDISTFDAEHVAGGYIPSGIALGVITATGKYGPYNNALANGTEVLKGFLFEEVKVVDRTTDSDVGAALFWTGVIRSANLPQFTGTGNNIGELDAAGKTDVAAWIKFEEDF